MLSSLNRTAIEGALRARGLAFAELALDNGVSALVVERGGRVLGPFLHPDAGSLFWVNPALGDPAAFDAFLARGEWNLGGERLWIAPEVQWLVGDRHNVDGTFAVPPAYDPGVWQLDAPPDAPPGTQRLRMQATLHARQIVQGSKSLTLERTLRPAPDPLRAAGLPDAARAGVLYAGYEQRVTLAGAPDDGISAQAWNVLQLHAGGQLIVPCSPLARITDYTDHVDDAHCTRGPHHVAFALTGARRYKIGICAAHTFGRLGYITRAGARACLIVRAFWNDPSALYSDEPAALPGARGDSIHVYNDGGSLGGFGELEVQGRAVGGETAHAVVEDPMLLWIYEGPAEAIGRIALHLLGLDPLA